MAYGKRQVELLERIASSQDRALGIAEELYRETYRGQLGAELEAQTKRAEAAERERDAARAEVERLRTALAKHGGHVIPCVKWSAPQLDCTCGLTAALTSIQESTQEEAS